MEKLKSKGIIVEMDGDEMTRIIWQMVKDRILSPFIELNLEYYDLGVKHRDDTDDQVTIDAANAIKKHGVGVKCATITPDAARVEEYDLKHEWRSPNGTIRAILDGTVFRKPIMVKNIPPLIRTWKKPIIIGRHAYGDIYKDVEMVVPGAGTGELVFRPKDGGEEMRLTVHEFDGPGVMLAMHNIERSMRSFVRSSINYALSEGVDLWFGAKDTISKKYDGRFKEIFLEEMAKHESEFEAKGLNYRYLLIDDAVAQILKQEGGILWACKNYDGDVFSDMLAAGFGSLGMMTSVLVSPDGNYEFEAAHGTVRRHYYRHKAGEKTSTNSVATIFAWTGAIRKRGEKDGQPEIMKFADIIEESVKELIESGLMTKDLTLLATPRPDKYLHTEEFIDAVASKVREKIESGALV